MTEAPWSTDLHWPAELTPFDPFDTDIQRDPYAHYAWLRDHAPVIRAGQREAPLYIVSRFDDVTDTLRNARDFSSVPRRDIVIPGFLLNSDPPDHTRLRQSASRAFSPRAIAAAETVIARLITERWQPILAAGGGEVIGSFASPLTISVIATVLGIPVSQSETMRDWTTAIIDYVGMLFRGVPSATANDSALKAMLAYINAVFDDVDVEQGETVVANLARLRDEGVLSAEEAAGFACQLFMAGHETTTLLTGNCLDFLSVNPDIFESLRAPDTIPKFIDEMVRYRPPVHRLTRYTTCEVIIAGCSIPAGSSVRLLIASANRDPTKFSDPDRFDPKRKNASHAGFGYGIHMCIGSWLAKLEVRLMLETLVNTTATLEPEPRWPRQPLAGGAFATVGLHSLGLKVTSI
ncbi:hypothetical protein ASE69_18385 [Sphingomonas sp. Leaf208]|uniref:cytochrome P450 n=1 Tax=Sphingomonas sp. Leaf208 TaxID=1735679 RepID=UPI000701D68F|nr:cytochrome P450 [Sphingomonas sp. Leaf208]KQM54467.1 hypothetical protein ASE69_18385 [Sphingomonas sp. Leaf208]